MYIDNNLSAALIPNSPVPSGAVNPLGAAAGTLGDSPFGKLIAQALADKGTTPGTETTLQTDPTAPSENGAVQGTESISDLLAGLLFRQAGQVKLKLQTSEDKTADNTESGGLSQSSAGTEEPDADSVMAMLAMFNGPFNAYLVMNSGSDGTTKTGLSAERVAAMLQSDQSGVSAINGLSDLTGTAGSLGALNGKNEPANSVKLQGQAADDSGKTTVSLEIGGKTVEFTGLMQNISDSGTISVNASEATAGNAAGGQAVKGMTAEELAALMQNKGQSAADPPTGIGRVDFQQTSPATGAQDMTAQGTQAFGAGGAKQDGMTASLTDQGRQKGTDFSADKPARDTDDVGDSLKEVAYQGQLHSAGASDAAVMNQPAKSADGAEAYSQISDQILKTLEKKGPSEFKMQLQPENLGQIDISLKISEGKLIIDIMADKSQTQALLNGQVDKLISSMGLQNVQVESVQVSQQMNSDSQSSQGQAYQMNQSMDFSQGRHSSGQTGESWRQAVGGMFGTQVDFAADDAAEEVRQAGGFGRMNYVI